MDAPRGIPFGLRPLGDPDDPTPPSTVEIMNTHITRKFKMPNIKAYNGTGDLANHVRTFFNVLLLQAVNDTIKCRAFPQILSGMEQRWYSRFPPNSIGSFQGFKSNSGEQRARWWQEAEDRPGIQAKDKYPRVSKYIDSSLKKGGPGQKFTEYARLNAPRSQILMEIEKDRDVHWPKSLNADPAKLDKSKYCQFHKDAGHDTGEYRQLNDEIEFLI
ncbi:uncharacterized protein LOC141714855 [Apium graveolens]|uniref:uncharacterized protein LOC141714855 n=1 Tax=Apium graveolens TaxID=4045 RepID=UPI003D7ABEA9